MFLKKVPTLTIFPPSLSSSPSSSQSFLPPWFHHLSLSPSLPSLSVFSPSSGCCCTWLWNGSFFGEQWFENNGTGRTRDLVMGGNRVTCFLWNSFQRGRLNGNRRWIRWTANILIRRSIMIYSLSPDELKSCKALYQGMKRAAVLRTDLASGLGWSGFCLELSMSAFAASASKSLFSEL